MPPKPPRTLSKPETADEIEKLVESILRNASAHGRLPTPVDELLASAKIEDASGDAGFLENFLRTADLATGRFLKSALQKIRGMADLRQKVVYASEGTPPRVRFAKLHELGHQSISWHNPFPVHQDDDFSLSPYAEELFDVEANYFAAEAMFQGERFTYMCRDFSASMDAVFKLADLHGASRHATLRRFVESHDEEVASITYFPSRYTLGPDGEPVLRGPRVVQSTAFAKKFGGLDVPATLDIKHPWASCRSNGNDILSGEMPISVKNFPQTTFEYWAWWNTYSLLILIRRAPLIKRIRKGLSTNPFQR